MTIATATRGATGPYVGTGAGAATYVFNFPIYSSGHLEVDVLSPTGVLATLDLSTDGTTGDYTLTGVGVGAGGSISLLANGQSWMNGSSLASGYKLYLFRTVPFTQLANLRAEGGYNPPTNEQALDLLCEADQQLYDMFARSLRFPLTDSPPDPLPSAQLRANGFQAYDANGDPIISSGVTTVPAGTMIGILNSFAALKALAVPASSVTYLVRGSAAAGDGGAGLFFWNASDTTADNGGTILAADAGGTGRWNRICDSGYVNVKWFGAKGDGVTDDTAAILAAINAVDATYGATVYAPGGKYIFSSAIALKKHVLLKGAGKSSTIFQSAHAGDGITSTWPINSNTAVWIDVEDLTIKNTNGANAGGGFVDVGGTYITLKRVITSGFKYGKILDQSELVDILNCDFELNLTGGLWLVDGADHTLGAAPQFTNRISVTGCQFNQVMGTGIGIIDDGGLCHSFQDNNYNGFVNHIRAAGAQGLAIRGGEWEGSSAANIVFASTTLSSATGVGACTAVTVGGGAIFVPQAGQSCVSITSTLALIIYDGVHFGNTAVAKVVGNANCNTCIGLAIWNAGGGATFDAQAVRHFELNPSVGGLTAGIASTNMQTVLSAQLTQKRITVTYSASMTPDAALGNVYEITATNATAHTINAPTNPTDGQRVTVTIRNTSGGALGVATWNAVFKMVAWVQPATGFSRSIDFKYNGTNWVEIGRTAADVPN